MRTRGGLPFILVTPFVVSNGADTDHRLYNYSNAVWQQAARVGAAQFDYNGLEAVLSDVRHDYRGQDEFFHGSMVGRRSSYMADDFHSSRTVGWGRFGRI
jgi:hypothetical protein